MKRALVLSGGGAKGAFQIGVIRELHSRGVTFGFTSGVSVGALNALLVAQEQTDLLERLWKGITSASNIYGKRLLGIVSPVFGFSSLYHQKPLKKMIRSYIDPILLRKSGIELRVGMVDLISGNYLVADQYHPFLHDCILASTAIPLAFPPVKIGKSPSPMVDGGIRNVAPLGEAIDWGAEEIHVILCNPEQLGPEERNYNNALHVVMRSLDILLDEIIRNDIEVCRLKNRIKESYRKIDIRVYAPREHLCSTLEFTPSSIRAAIEKGHKTAREVFDAIS